MRDVDTFSNDRSPRPAMGAATSTNTSINHAAVNRSPFNVPTVTTINNVAMNRSPYNVPKDTEVTKVTATNVNAGPTLAVALDKQVDILKFLAQHGDSNFKKEAMQELMALAKQR